jgi:hypothetical protein
LLIISNIWLITCNFCCLFSHSGSQSPPPPPPHPLALDHHHFTLLISSISTQQRYIFSFTLFSPLHGNSILSHNLTFFYFLSLLCF